MNILGMIPARGGSRGVPQKNIRDLLGKPVITYSVKHARQSQLINKIVVSSDDTKVEQICQDNDILFLPRPDELATDKARIDDAMRHCVKTMEEKHNFKTDILVLLYANVPVRAPGILDKAIQYLIDTNADSVQTVAPVNKFHPYWMYTIDEDKPQKFIDNNVYRRQSLPELFVVDGAVGVVRTAPLMAAENSDDPHAFWGQDRRVLVQNSHDTVDIDTMMDFFLAETVLRNGDNNSR